MTVQPIFSQAETTKKLSFTAQSIVECRAFSSTQDVGKVLSVTAHAETVGCEAVNKEVRYSGKVVYHLVWTDGEGRLQKTEVGAEFSHKAEHPEVVSSARIDVDICLERTEVRPVNGSLMVTSVATAKIQTTTLLSTPYLTGGEGLVTRNESVPLYAVQRCNAQMTVGDEWETKRVVKDVLLPCVCASVTSAGTGIGYAACDGEVEVTLLCLDSDGLPFTERRKIPYRIEAEGEGVMPNMAVTASVAIKNVKVSATVDADKSLTILAVDVTCEARADVAVERAVECVIDAYSPTRHLTEKREQIVCQLPVCVRSTMHRMVGKVGAEDVTAQDAVLVTYPLGVQAAVTAIGDGTVTVEGVVSAVALIKKEDGYTAPVLELPFSVSVEATGVRIGDTITVDACVGELSARTVANGEVELSVELKLSLCVYRATAQTVIADIEIGEEKKVSTAAISVCYPQAGSTLWDIAKDLGVSPEQVLAFNEELQFPLTGEERVVVYRRLVAE